ncbi:unnamed protein product [Thlaspi arvense]|uniref:AT hook motif-containing protein n=1 Tax=Thlaspi arvense TaxID=13288 RepID=A0AAU9T2W1_THLAR|nr:unnamed protein product [Thlaspi arvense]
MNPLTLASTSSPPPVANDVLAKRKRGRPRKDESLAQQEKAQVTPKPDINLVGQMVSGVVEGSFDAGYILNVKVKDSDAKLRGLVFIPGKVVPVTPENDVAPRVKMFTREEIKNQTDHGQPSRIPPNDQLTKDAVVINDVEISEPAQALSLMPKESNGEAFAVKGKEAVPEINGAAEKGEAATRLVEFFPTPGTNIVTAQPNLALAQKETMEQQKPPGETRGFDLMAEEPGRAGEKVPKELQLELGSKAIQSGDNNGDKMEIDPKSPVSKSGFIANLFEGEKKGDCDMEEGEATPSAQ